MKRESWLPAEPESAAAARGLVREAASEFGLEQDAVWDLQLATTEAVANAVMHGVPCEEHGFLLRIESCDHGLCVEVCDCGQFVPRFAVPDAGELGAVSGRGLPIIAAVSDIFEIAPDDEQTRVRFGKRLAAA